MSLKTVFMSVVHAVGIGGATATATVSGAATTSLHQLGGSLAGSVAVAGEQSGPIGAAISTAIKASDQAAAANPAMTSGDKLKSAIASVAPVVIMEAAKVGLSGIEAEAERFAEMAIENALSLLKSTPLAKLGAALLHDLGIKI